METGLKSLKVEIVADATPAIDAFKNIGKASTATNTKLNTLSKTLSSVNTELKEFKKVANGLKQVNQDAFKFGNAKQTLAGMVANARTLKSLFKGGGDGLKASFASAEKTLKRIDALASKKHKIVFDGKGAGKTLDRLERLYNRIEKINDDSLALLSCKMDVLLKEIAFSKDNLAIEKEIHKLRKDRVEFARVEYNIYRNLEKRVRNATEKLVHSSAKPIKIVYRDETAGKARTTKTEQRGRFSSDSKKAYDVELAGHLLQANGLGYLSRALDKNSAALGKNTNKLATLTAGFFLYHKMLSGVGRASQDIQELQTSRARVDAWGLSKEERAQFDEIAENLKKSNKFLTKSGAVNSVMAGASSLGHWNPDVISKAIGKVVESAQFQRMMGYNTSEIEDIVKNIFGVAEARQQADNPDKVINTTKLVTDIVSTTGGKVSVADIETILRNLGPTAFTISDDGLRRIAALAEQTKVSGRGNSGGGAGAGVSSIGTQLKQMVQMGLGKPSAQGAKKQLGQSGLLSDSAYKQALSTEAGQLGLALLNVVNEKMLKKDVGSDVYRDPEYHHVISASALKANKDLARVGFYDSNVLQQDPVLWVQKILPPIVQQISKAENRKEYFGDFANGKEKQSDAEFMTNITREAMDSALNVFWAKTGLSTRVVGILSTLSSQGYQLRSEETFKTSFKQRDPTEFMYQRGELKPAILGFQTSITNLVQAFEPLALMIGKIINLTTEFVNKLSEWAEQWGTLATATGGWAIIKLFIAGVSHTVHAYNLLDSAITRHTTTLRENIAAQLTRNTLDGKAQVQNIVPAVTNTMVKTRAVIVGTLQTIAGFAMKALSGVGWALLAIDIGSVVADWVKDFKIGTKTIGEHFSDMLKGMGIRLNSIKEENLAIAASNPDVAEKVEDLKKKIEDAKAQRAEIIKKLDGYGLFYLTMREKNPHADLNTLITKLTQDIRKNEEKLEAIANSKANVLTRSKEINDGMIGALKKSGIYDKLQKISNYKANISKQKEELLKPNLTQNSIDRLNASIERDTHEMKLAINEILTNPQLNNIKELSAYFDGSIRPLVENNTALQAISNKQFERLNTLLDNLAGILTNGKTIAVSSGSIVNLKDEGGKPKTTLGGNASKTTTKAQSTEKVLTPVQKHLSKLNQTIEKNSHITKNGDGDYESLNDSIRNAKREIYENIVQRKLTSRDGSIPLLDKGMGTDASTSDVKYEDLNFNQTIDGSNITGNQLAYKTAIANRAKIFNAYLKSYKFDLDDELEKSIKETFKTSEASKDRLSSYKGHSADFLDMDRRNKEQLDKIRERIPENNPIWNKHLAEVDKKQRLLGFNKSMISANTTVASDRDETERLNLASMTQGEQLTYNYKNQQAEDLAKKDQLRREIEYRAQLAEAVASSAEERAKIEEAKNEELAKLEEAYHKKSLAKEKDYQRQKNSFGDGHLRQKVEDWKNFGKQLESLQDGIMDGFIKADIAWLDGDKKAWKQWGLDLLKMLRDMFLKQGMADILGGITKSITDGIGSLFGRDEKNGEGGGISTLANGIAQMVGGSKGKEGETGGFFNGIGSFFSGIGSKVAGFFGGGGATVPAVTQFGGGGLLGQSGLMGAGMQGTLSATPMAGGILGQTGIGMPGMGMANMGISNPALPTMGASLDLGLGTGMGMSGSAMGAGGGLFDGLTEQAQNLTDQFKDVGDISNLFGDSIQAGADFTKDLGAGFDMMTATTEAANAATDATTIVETAGQAIKQTSNTTETTGTLNLQAFNGFLQAANSSLIEFTASLQSAKMANAIPHANGGVMTSKGSMPLKMYANGGIAKSAQVAIFGEGSKPEAYVPLPDGRSIPVSLNVDATGGGKRDQMGNNYNISISVTNNSDGGTSSKTNESNQSDPDLKKIAGRLKDIVQQEIANQSRPGGLLYNQRY